MPPRHNVKGDAKVERDARIVKAWNAGGVTLIDIGSRFGLSVDAVGKILREAEAKGVEVRRVRKPS